MADWTGVADKFHKAFNSKKLKGKSSTTFNTLASRQVSALYQLHTSMNSNKALFNLQLAATHIAFMLDHDSDGQVGIINGYI